MDKKRLMKRLLPGLALLVPVILAGCVPGQESDLLTNLIGNAESLGGKMTVTTNEGETYTITISKTGVDQSATATKDHPKTDADEDKPKATKEKEDALESILPSLNSEKDVFKTLGLWEKAAQYREQDLSWAHTAAELGFDPDTLYASLQNEIEARLKHALELGLISQEQLEKKFSYYDGLALKWTGIIFTDEKDDDDDETIDPASLVPPMNHEEDLFVMLGLGDQAAQHREQGLTWAETATELGFTEDTLYTHLYEVIEADLHEAKSAGKITVDQYEELLEQYGHHAAEWATVIFSS